MAADARAWELVLARVESDLLAGRLQIGDHLAPERALATELGVGRSSVREAVRVLEVMGLVRTGTGSGPNAGAVVISKPGGGMSVLMRLQVAGRGFGIDDVVATRLLLEASVVADLASSEASLDPVEPLLEAMAATDSREEFLALDARFHTMLAELAGNTVVTAVMSGLRGSIEEYVVAGAQSIEDWPAMAARLLSEHRGILVAIRSGDPDAARSAITRHISGYYADTDLSGSAAHTGRRTASPL